MIAYYDKSKKEGYLLFNDNYNSQSVPTIRLSDTAIHDLAHIACRLYTEAFGEKYKEGEDETESRPYKCFDDYSPVDAGPTKEMVRGIVNETLRDIENSRVFQKRNREDEE